MLFRSATINATTANSNDDAKSGVAEDPLLAAIGFDAVTVDELAIRTNTATHLLAAQLMALELDGHIAQIAGGKYQRLSG